MKNPTHQNKAEQPILGKLAELRNIHVKVAQCFEFYYIVEGKITANCYEEVHRLKTGDMFMATPGQAFMLIPDHEPSLYIHLKINPSFIQTRENQIHKRLPCVLEASKIRQAQLNLFYRIYEEIYQDNFDQIHELVDVFLQKLNWIRPKNEEEIQSDKKIDLILKATAVFETEEPGLEELAKYLEISPSYLSRVFKEVTGMRFSDFSQRKKLERSSQLLLSGLSIEEIAKEIGFTSSKSLNRIYRQFVKTTPSTYRKYLLRLTDKLKSEEDLRFKCSFQNFLTHNAEPSYTNTMKEYLGAGYNSHSLSITDPIIQDPTLGQRAISLDNFSEDYLEEIKQLPSINSNSLLALNLEISLEESEDIFFKDLNRWAKEEELFKLLDLVNSIDIPIILSLGLKDHSIQDYCNKHQREELGEYLKILEVFYKKLIKNITRPLAEKYFYVFDTSAIMELDTQKAILYFFEFMEKYHLMMERLLYTVNYQSVYQLGKQQAYELESIIDFISKNRHRIRLPQHSNAHIILPQRLTLKEPHQLLGALKLYNEAIDELNAFDDDLRLKKTKIKLQGIDMNMDLDFVDPLYIELFFSILTLDFWMHLKGKSRLVPNYNFNFRCRTKESTFSSKLIGKNGFPTPLYHISKFISQMPQDVIYHKEGCLISKNEDEIHMLVYTNPFLDYSFSLEKGFEQLEAYKREVSIDISGLNGHYKEVTQIINYKHGSPFFQLRNFSRPELMSSAERDYVRQQSTPLLMTDYIEVKDEINLNLVLTPFEVLYKTFTKIKDPS